MVKVTIRNNLKPINVIVDENTAIKKVLDDNGVDYTKGVMHLNGSSLRADDLTHTFADFGVTDSCFLTSVIKADNA